MHLCIYKIIYELFCDDGGVVGILVTVKSTRPSTQL